MSAKIDYSVTAEPMRAGHKVRKMKGGKRDKRDGK